MPPSFEPFVKKNNPAAEGLKKKSDIEAQIQKALKKKVIKNPAAKNTQKTIIPIQL